MAGPQAAYADAMGVPVAQAEKPTDMPDQGERAEAAAGSDGSALGARMGLRGCDLRI